MKSSTTWKHFFSPKVRHMYSVGAGSGVVPVDLLREEERKKRPKVSQVELDIRAQLAGTFIYLMHSWSLGWCSVNPVQFGAGIFDMGLDLFPLFLCFFFMGRDSVKALFGCRLWLTASPVQPGL